MCAATFVVIEIACKTTQHTQFTLAATNTHTLSVRTVVDINKPDRNASNIDTAQRIRITNATSAWLSSAANGPWLFG